VLGRGDRPQAFDRINRPCQPADAEPLPWLEFDVDYALLHSRSEVGRRDRFSEIVEMLPRKLEFMMVFDGTTVEEAQTTVFDWDPNR
jgi:hypothetical protein